MVGSDIDNFRCMYCGCHDRERHLFMFFDKLGLWRNIKDSVILHFAPERHLARRLDSESPSKYVKADLHPKNEDVERMDATILPYNEDKFDFIIANHVLEHIPDYGKALREFFRVLKPGGIGIFQTPYSKLLQNNFEDEGIDSDELRLFFHGQKNHVRTFGYNQFLSELETVGFDVQVKKHDECFDAHAAYLYGVNSKEDLILAVKRVS